ncbi:MAG: hypothetical protein ACRDLF_00755 [Solirubrobacteraceae bacterium]
MFTVFLALIAGGLGGGVVAALLSRRGVRRNAPETSALDPELERRIGGAAAQWAAAHGQPAAAPLVADKLRLTYVLSRQPQRRRRRWSR